MVAGVDFMICPNSIAGVNAEQSRHQLRFAVDDLNQVVEKARQAGSPRIDELVDAKTYETTTISDPEGNTIELIQYKP
jgi:predicted enzyme related to lactoylglutathione lyase